MSIFGEQTEHAVNFSEAIPHWAETLCDIMDYFVLGLLLYLSEIIKYKLDKIELNITC